MVDEGTASTDSYGLGSHHVVDLSKYKDLSPGNSRIAWPPDHYHGKDNIVEARPKGSGNCHSENESRKGKKHITNAHNKLIDPSSQVSSSYPKNGPNTNCQPYHYSTDTERDPAPVYYPAENVAPYIVCAKDMPTAGRG